MKIKQYTDYKGITEVLSKMPRKKTALIMAGLLRLFGGDMTKDEEVVYTVPLHAGQVVEVPKGTKVVFYDPITKKGSKGFAALKRNS